MRIYLYVQRLMRKGGIASPSRGRGTIGTVSRMSELRPLAYPGSRHAKIRRRQSRETAGGYEHTAMSDKLRALPVFGLILLLLTASFSQAESKNEVKKSYEAIVSKASRDLTEEKIDEAAKDAAQAEKLDPNNPQTANLLGIVASKKKDYPEAVTQFNRALTENPKFYTAKFNLADVLMLQGDYNQARTILADLSEIDPKSEVVQFKFALSYVLANQTDEAMSFIDMMDFPGKTPAYYYARAAVWLKKGLTKDANQYGVNAHKYYTDGQCNYFVSVLREMGLNVSVL
jgi:predicted Zn-dependent protease